MGARGMSSLHFNIYILNNITWVQGMSSLHSNTYILNDVAYLPLIILINQLFIRECCGLLSSRNNSNGTNVQEGIEKTALNKTFKSSTYNNICAQ